LLLSPLFLVSALLRPCLNSRTELLLDLLDWQDNRGRRWLSKACQGHSLTGLRKGLHAGTVSDGDLSDTTVSIAQKRYSILLTFLGRSPGDGCSSDAYRRNGRLNNHRVVARFGDLP